MGTTSDPTTNNPTTSQPTTLLPTSQNTMQPTTTSSTASPTTSQNTLIATPFVTNIGVDIQNAEGAVSESTTLDENDIFDVESKSNDNDGNDAVTIIFILLFLFLMVGGIGMLIYAKHRKQKVDEQNYGDEGMQTIASSSNMFVGEGGNDMNVETKGQLSDFDDDEDDVDEIENYKMDATDIEIVNDLNLIKNEVHATKGQMMDEDIDNIFIEGQNENETMGVVPENVIDDDDNDYDIELMDNYQTMGALPNDQQNDYGTNGFIE